MDGEVEYKMFEKGKLTMLKNVAIGSLVLVGINILVLNWWIFLGDGPDFARRLDLVETRLDSLITREDYRRQGFDEDMIIAKAATGAASLLRADLVDTKQGPAELGPTSTPEVQVVQAVGTSGVREFFIPLGSGSTFSREWTDITSATAPIDSSRYSVIEAVYLEASLHVINGRVYARLVDDTGDRIYHDSEISHNSSTAQWVSSSSISLGGGSRTYKVQLKSDVGEQAIMDQARLRILVK